MRDLIQLDIIGLLTIPGLLVVITIVCICLEWKLIKSRNVWLESVEKGSLDEFKVIIEDDLYIGKNFEKLYTSRKIISTSGFFFNRTQGIELEFLCKTKKGKYILINIDLKNYEIETNYELYNERRAKKYLEPHYDEYVKAFNVPSEV